MLVTGDGFQLCFIAVFRNGTVSRFFNLTNRPPKAPAHQGFKIKFKGPVFVAFVL